MGERQAAEAAAGLRARALHEVEAGGYAWRIRRVGQRDLAQADHAVLMVFSREALASKEPPTPEQAVAQVRQMSPDALAQLNEAGMAILRAAVVAFRELPDGAWIDCQIVDDDDAPPVDARGRALLPVRDLPEGAEAFLTAEARRWAAGGAAGVAALQAFRKGVAGDATAPAPAGEGVRAEALDPVAGG